MREMLYLAEEGIAILHLKVSNVLCARKGGMPEPASATK